MEPINNSKKKLNDKKNWFFKQVPDAHLIFFFFFLEKKNAHLASVWIQIINENYVTIQLIFATIYASHYTISTNFYFYLQYFQQ